MDKKLIYGSATTYSERTYITVTRFNPLIHTLKSQSNGPLYSDTVIGRRAVDGWAGKCNIWYSEEGPGRGGGAAPPSPLLAVPINCQCTSFILFDVAL